MQAPHLVVVGAGFGGLALVRGLRRSDYRITLNDRRNHHLFQPLLYQVATAGLAPGDIAEPIRRILARQANVRVRLGEVTRIDRASRCVFLGDEAIAYDALCVATGASHHYFGHDEWAAAAPGLKTLADALDVRRRILTAFERAEWTEDADERRALLTFVVVGGGPTGVELAGAIREIATKTLRREFRAIDPVRDARVVLVEAGDAVLGAFPAPLPARARAQLEALGVEVRLGRPVARVDADGVEVGGEAIVARTVLWAAGVRGSGCESGVPCARLDLAPRTGRSHQLRLHLRTIGHTILGDDLYGTDAERSAALRLCLHARALSFTHPHTGERCSISSRVPF